MTHMYTRGRYYRRKRHFPLFKHELVVAAAVAVLAFGGLYGALSRGDGASDLLGSRQEKQYGRKLSLQERLAAKQPLAAVGVSGGAAGADVTVKKGAAVNVNADGLNDPVKKELAMRLVSSAENSSLDWKAQYAYIEDIQDGRGYTAGIIGFCSGTGDMLELVQYYTLQKPSNPLAAYLPALRSVNGTSSHAGLGDSFVAAWRSAAGDPVFQMAQDHMRDTMYFNPAVNQAKADGLGTLGQFIYYDAMVMHGPGESADSFGGLRAAVMGKAKTPAKGGDQVAYLNAFLDAREALMRTEAAHSDTSRVGTAQRAFLKAGNLNLDLPLAWNVYGDAFSVQKL